MQRIKLGKENDNYLWRNFSKLRCFLLNPPLNLLFSDTVYCSNALEMPTSHSLCCSYYGNSSPPAQLPGLVRRPDLLGQQQVSGEGSRGHGRCLQDNDSLYLFIDREKLYFMDAFIRSSYSQIWVDLHKGSTEMGNMWSPRRECCHCGRS